MTSPGRSVHDGNMTSHGVTIGGEALLRPFGFRRRVAQHAGLEVHYLEGRGRGGPDLVFLHGLGDRNSTWHRVLWRLRLGAWGRIVCPDLVGFGRTYLPDGRAMPSMDEGMEIMSGALASLGVDQPIIVGNSLGAWLGWRMLERYPDLISGCLMLAPGGFMTKPELRQLVGRFLAGDHAEMTHAIIGDARPEMMFFARRIIGAMLDNPLLQTVCRQDSSHLLYRAGDLESVAGRARCLWGELDTLMPASGVEMLRSALGEGLVMERVGHAPQQTRPGLVVRELGRLREQLKRTRRADRDAERVHRPGERAAALEPTSPA